MYVIIIDMYMYVITYMYMYMYMYNYNNCVYINIREYSSTLGQEKKWLPIHFNCEYDPFITNAT